MTWEETYKNNRKWISRYQAYLPFIENETDELKLTREISRLVEQNIEIKHLTVMDYESDSLDTNLEIPWMLWKTT